MPDTVLVTGATGFVGNHLIARLIKDGYTVRCLVRDKEKAEELKQRYSVELVYGDVTDRQSLKGISKGVSYVFHLAAVGHVSAISEESYRLFTGTNEGGTMNMIKEFRNSDSLRKFVHFSSTAAMGPIGLPVLNECSRPNPVTPYQKSKYRSEKIVLAAAERIGFPAVIVRPCMIYGPGGTGEFYKFCRLMKKGFFPKVGLGENLTPLVYVEDVVSGAVLAALNGKSKEAYILASEKSIPMDEMRNLIMKSIGTKAPYLFVPSPVALLGAKLLEWACSICGKEPIATYRNIKSTVTDRTFDITKAQTELDYRVKKNFEEGIAETIQWYKTQGLI